MGYSITWCAIREEAAEKFLSHLGLSTTGESETDPESRFSTANLSTGWRLFLSNKYDCSLLVKGVASFSGEHELLLCRVEEHVMASSAEWWLRGSRKWRISHEGENGPKGLDVDGEAPECFASIRKEMEATQRAEGGEQADVDYIFEIPLKVAQTLVGFKHDENYASVIGGDFMVLSDGTSKKGFLSRVFGK